MNISKVQNSAYNAYIYTNNKDFKKADTERIKFYKEGRKNPFMAMLIDSNAQDKALNEICAKGLKKPLKILLTTREKIFCAFMPDSKLAKYSEKLNKKFNQLYPKTGAFRRDLILYEQIKLNEVTPKLGTEGRRTLETLKALAKNASDTLIQRHNFLR